MVEVQGHRGARGRFPENTLEGFSATLHELGVAAFELDVGLTADGVVVLSHDAALNPELTRGPDGAWLPGPGPLIRSLTARELASFDVGRMRPGSPYARRFPDQRPIDGARIPRLADVLRLDGVARLTIELKTFPDRPDWTAAPEVMADAVAAELDAAGATARVVVESFDWRCLHHLRRTRPDLALGWLTRASLGAATRLWWNGVDPADHGGSTVRAVAAQVPTQVPAQVAGRRAATWLPEFTDLTRAAVDEAHERGMRVVTWTVNAAADLARLAASGVDGVISDYPDRFSAARRPPG